MKPRHLLMGALLGLFSLTGLAANPAPAAATAAGGGKMERGGWCKAHADDCSAQAAKFDQWCSTNSDKCQALKAGIERRREFCENNKAECKEQREQARADMKEWCQSHADRPMCKAMNEREQENDEDAPPPG